MGPAVGPTYWCDTPTASPASSSIRSGRRSPARHGSKSSRCASPQAARRRRSCHATRPRSRGSPTWPVWSCIRIRCAPRTSTIPTSCAWTSIPCPASSGRRCEPSRASSKRRCTTSGLPAGRRRQARAACTSSCASHGAGPLTKCAARRWRWRATWSGALPRSRRANGGRKSATVCSWTTTRTPRIVPSRRPTRCGRRPMPASRRRSVGTKSRAPSRRTSRSPRCPSASPRWAIAMQGLTGLPDRSKACSSYRPGTSARGRGTRPGRRTTRSSAASLPACSRPRPAGPAPPSTR